ncbi:MAG TPA: SxtJ family membrane protein [Vicinamibacterales bacterium]|nr:SxtJ family membrane protein [Vicinamibacterales bacterium]
MNWSDVIKPASTSTLRQFGGLCLVVFGGLAAWRLWHGNSGTVTIVLAAASVLIGVTGLTAPAAVRPVFTAWMIVAFPIGWAVSRIALGLMFFVLFTAVGLVFRLSGRDPLLLRRSRRDTYWLPKPQPRSGEEYLRQF